MSVNDPDLCRQGVGEPRWIATAEELSDFCDLVQQDGLVAFDTEFMRGRSYTPRLCLIQAARPSGIALIDPTDLDTRPFWDTVISPEIITIVFAGSQDLEICYLWTGRAPQNVFDVQVAASLLGARYPSSYRVVAGTLLGVELKQSETYTDWAQRPLTREQVEYAVEDVAMLLPLFRKLTALLEAKSRVAWMREEMLPLESADSYDPEQKADATNVKGSKSLSPRERAIVVELAKWRERLAWGQNVPAKFVVPDECLCELAKKQPRTPAAVMRFRGFPGARGEHLAFEASEAIARGLRVPEPLSVVQESSGNDEESRSALVDVIAALAKSICLREGVCHHLVATKRDYEDFVRALERSDSNPSSSEPRLLRGWRHDVVGSHLKRVVEENIPVRMVKEAGTWLLVPCE